MDAIIQGMFPTVMMPREGMIEPATNNGTRYVVARDGLWREVMLPWVTVLHKIAHSDFMLPYGPAKDTVALKCGPIPSELRSKFVQDAKAAMPNEMAAAVVWNSNDHSWRYEKRENMQATADLVEYHEVQLGDGEYLVLDLHSHGTFSAFFSQKDDQDDMGSMKFSGVIGNLDTGDMTSVLRLNMLGQTWDADLASNGKLEVLCK
ncbi:PRTRC system protein A [Polaromonas aquatica]|uniref:PRTRC system protein A n=1 Tax=Polaromonas aquatica TaxID=332657 RepID=A0ABW1TVD2_9BURK